MSTLTNYIIKGAIAAVAGVAIGECLIIAKDTIKLRKKTLKTLKESPDAREDLNDIKKSSKFVLDCIKIAAKNRVEEIKKDPMAEIAALWGCATFMFGNWKGFNNGFHQGWDYGSGDVNRLMRHFKDKYPVELAALVKKALDDKDEVQLSKYIQGDTLYSASWIAERCDLPKIKEVTA